MPSGYLFNMSYGFIVTTLTMLLVSFGLILDGLVPDWLIASSVVCDVIVELATGCQTTSSRKWWLREVVRLRVSFAMLCYLAGITV